MVPFDRLCIINCVDCVLLVFFSIFVPKMHKFLSYSTCKYTVTLKPGLGVTQGHQKLE